MLVCLYGYFHCWIHAEPISAQVVSIVNVAQRKRLNQDELPFTPYPSPHFMVWPWLRISREAVYHPSAWWTTNVSRCRERYVTISGFESEIVTKSVRCVLVFGSLDELGRSFFYKGPDSTSDYVLFHSWLCHFYYSVTIKIAFKCYVNNIIYHFVFPATNDSAGDQLDQKWIINNKTKNKFDALD